MPVGNIIFTTGKKIAANPAKTCNTNICLQQLFCHLHARPVSRISAHDSEKYGV